MQANFFAEVRARDDLAVLIEVQAPGVAAALTEQLEGARDRMITPDALLEFDPANVRIHRAAVRSVEPAVRSPRQGIGERVRVLHAEAAQQHFGIAISNVVVIRVRVEQQIWRLRHKHTAVTERHARSEI